MKVLYGQELVDELRKIMDESKRRIWIAVPYLGGMVSVKKILGEKWLNNPKIEFKFLTDFENNTALDSKTMGLFYQRGEVKTLIGLHAKIYISDLACLITSANLTNTAFSKRHEAGILINHPESEEVIKLFENLWEKSDDIKLETIRKIKKSISKSVEEKNGTRLKQHWKLPTSEKSEKTKKRKNKFVDYFRIVADFKNFALKYEQIQRVWENEPLFFEIDGLFNYLYHHAPGIPSKKYKDEKIKARILNESEQLKEIEKWAIAYKKWNKLEKGGNDISERLIYSEKLANFFSNQRILELNKSEIKELLLCTNSMRVDQRNIPQIFKKNELTMIKSKLQFLIFGEASLPGRMAECKKIKNLGISTINEIVGLTSPTEYPIINRNSISGMKFFGYNMKLNK